MCYTLFSNAIPCSRCSTSGIVAALLAAKSVALSSKLRLCQQFAEPSTHCSSQFILLFFFTITSVLRQSPAATVPKPLYIAPQLLTQSLARSSCHLFGAGRQVHAKQSSVFCDAVCLFLAVINYPVCFCALGDCVGVVFVLC